MLNDRVYYTADKYILFWIPAGILLIAIGLVTLSAFYAGYTPTVTDEQQNVDTGTVSFNAATSSEVRKNYEGFQKGDTITGPIYFSNNTNPELTVTQELKSDDKIDVRSTIYVRVNGSVNGFAYFENRIPVLNEDITVQDVSTRNSSINITEIRRIYERIQRTYFNAGSVQADIVIENQYSNENYSGEIMDSMSIRFREQTYTVLPPSISENQTKEFVSDVDIIESQNTIYRDLGAVLLIAGIILVLVKIMISDSSRVKIDYKFIHFSDWFSTSKGAELDLSGKDVIKLSYFDDIVDVAADSNNRAILFEKHDRLAVISEGTVYEYHLTEQDKEPVWFDPLGITDQDSESSNSDDGEDSPDSDSSDNKESDGE